MPLVSKRKREEENVDKQSKKSKQAQFETKTLREYGNIGYCDDQWHSLFRTIPEDIEETKKIICQYMCSFLNGSGGILCFGCRSNGKVYGEIISRKEEDNIRLIIDDTIKRFHPFVSPSNYRITFTPVLPFLQHKEVTSVRYILEIRVAPGDPYQLYETEFHEVFLRSDTGTAYGPLTPHEIKRHVLQQFKKKLDRDKKLCNHLKPPEPERKIEIVRPLPIPDNTVLTSKTTPPIKECGSDQLKPVDASTDRSQSQNLNGYLITTATAVIQNPTSVTITVTSSTNISTITVPLPKCSVITPTVIANVCHKSKDKLEGEILDKKSTSSVAGSINSHATVKKTDSQTVKNSTQVKPQSMLTKTAVCETETRSGIIVSQLESQQKSWSHAESSKQQTQTSATKSQAQTSTNKFHPDSSKQCTQTSTNKSEADSNKPQTQTSTAKSQADSNKPQTQTSTAKSQAGSSKPQTQTSTAKSQAGSSKPQTQTSTAKSQAGSSKQQVQTNTSKSNTYSNNQAHSKPTVPVTPIVKSNTTLIPTISHYYSRSKINPYSNIQHSHNTATPFSYLPSSSHPPHYVPPNFPWTYPPFSSSYHHYYPYQ